MEQERCKPTEEVKKMTAEEKVKILRDMCRKISVWKLDDALNEVESCHREGKVFAGHTPMKVTEDGVVSGGSPMYKQINDEVLASLYAQVIESLSAASKEIQRASEEIQNYDWDGGR
tara:strand:+ start:10 stop:360 length:351 start_codon:yes stop_codon:yes gene_type:complete